MLCVSADDYNKVMKFQVKGDIDAKQTFLHKFKHFQVCQKAELQKLADKLIFIEYKPGKRCRLLVHTLVPGAVLTSRVRGFR